MSGIHRIVHCNGHGTSCQTCGHVNPINPTIEPATLADHFLREYYHGTSNSGWNAVQHLFDHDCVVMVKDKNVGNAHDLLNSFSSEYIKRANYDNLRTKWIVLSNDTLMINVFGHIQLVGFHGHVSYPMVFSETFIVQVSGNNAKCTHHTIDF
jgi:hypothetical protein